MSLITYLTRVHFADRVLEDALESELALLGASRPLVVADGPEALDRLMLSLPRGTRAAAAFVPPSGPAREADCAAAALTLAAEGCDCVIAVGGAGAIDAGKIAGLAGAGAGIAALLAGAGGAGGAGGGRARPVIAVPTTADSGAGVRAAVRVLTAAGRHHWLRDRRLVPAAALCDPTLAAADTPAATAAAGLDALTHCLETFLGNAFNPPADGIALEGLRRAGRHLEPAVADGTDLGARRELLAAALNGALADQKGLGGVHALAHALEEARGAAAPRHGSLHAALLPPVLAFNAPAGRERFAAVAAALGLAPGADLPEALLRLAERLPLPARLGPLGLDGAQLDRVARRAEADPANLTNPRLASAADYRAMLEAAL
ncbi:MAG: iron-containing alcohol dehydrogenase [Rhodobacteraceae bacterium]|nr:iron-containing alcohol dehydrogenase [Paracoccaceae bacterium]